MHVAEDSFPIDVDPTLPGHPDPYPLLHRLRADGAGAAMARMSELALNCHYVRIPYTLTDWKTRVNDSVAPVAPPAVESLTRGAGIPAYDVGILCWQMHTRSLYLIGV